jgi:lysine-N-methylase
MLRGIRNAHGLAMPEVFGTLPAALPELATRAMQRFSCLGSACEDSCCRDFGVSIDRESLERMRAAVAKDPVPHGEVVRLVVLGMPRDGTAAQNLVPLDDHGACPLLEPSGACGVQRDYGEALLGTTCAVFPRTAIAVAGHLEVTGSLACPELARLTLLSEDGLERETPPVPVMPPARNYVGQVLDHDPAAPYGAMFSEVRGVLMRLFARADYPIGSRVVFAANLAAQVDGFFSREHHASTRAGSVMMERRLRAELAVAMDEATLRDLHADLRALEGGHEAVVGAAVSMLLDRRRLTHAPRFAQLMDRAMSRLEADCLAAPDAAKESADGTAAREREVTAARLSEIDRSRRRQLGERLPGLIDEILGRYCRHYLLRNPYTNSTSLLSYLGRLCLSLAAIRLLWTASVDLDGLDDLDDLDGLDGPGRAPTAVADAARASAILVVQTFTKAISHHSDFLDAIHEADDRPGGMTFGRLVLFAKFV